MGNMLHDAPLNRLCTFLTGGRARDLAFVYNTDDLAAAASAGALILGRGSNVLIGDEGYDGYVAVNRTATHVFTGDEAVCDSGVLLGVLARAYAQEGREGLSWAQGLPGSVGGATVGNAGAFGGCMADAVLRVSVWHDGKERMLTREECGFTYRGSAVPGTVLRVWLRAPFGNAEEIRAAGEKCLAARRQRQPLGASAGSVFRAVKAAACAIPESLRADDWPKARTGDTIPAYMRAGDIPAGWLLERAGVKGWTCGGAEISQKHANFIVNRGGATSGDILQLMNAAQAAVYDTFGVKLEREIQLIGEFI